jgi:oligopeptide transport system ATP-binding protein
MLGNRKHAIPTPDEVGRAMSENQPLVDVQDLKIYFPIFSGIIKRRTGYVKAVDGISLKINQGETLGLVGESGCGKTTTGWAILQLYKPFSGSISYSGQNLTRMPGQHIQQFRRRIQMIFQDPSASLNPRMTIGAIVEEPLSVHHLVEGKARKERVRELLTRVGLNPDYMDRYPHQFSGGQKQRIGIARALAVQPEFIVCDEPISSLDVSIQAQVINLLQDLQAQENLTYLFIAHDLSVVRHISTRVAVMYLGKIVEVADRMELYDKPLHPYTQALLSAVFVPDPRKEKVRKQILLDGDLPSPANPPSGCRFHTRCPLVMEICKKSEPPSLELGKAHQVACFKYS